ncbi:11493_t:CDS:1, partial [Acaulospora morrowiae]
LETYCNELDINQPTDIILDDNQIIQIVLDKSKEHNHSNSDQSEEFPLISIKEGKNALQMWIKYFEQQNSSEFDINDIKVFRKYSH